MRRLTITVYQRAGVTRDNSYYFNSDKTLQNNAIDSPVRLTQSYQLVSLDLDYSINSSHVTSMMILSLNEPQSDDNILRSGQPVEITDNGAIVFQGVILNSHYNLMPMTENSHGGLFLMATLAPSIYQLTLAPVIFDSTQADQISQLTGIDSVAILSGNVAQSIKTTALLNYMVTNTDYNRFFNKTISAQNLADDLYLMTTAGEPRDITLRQSIDYYNCVLYQQENGTIIIRQLDASVECPFDIDLSNQYNGTDAISATLIDGTVPIVPVLSYEYNDNAYSTPAAVSNYCMLSPNDAISSKAGPAILTYSPNPAFFPRIKELQLGGWFVGQIGITQINDNIANNPATRTALTNFAKSQDQYMISSTPTGVRDQFLAAYQALLTAKQMGTVLAGYSGLNATISLDDPNLPSDIGSILGTVLQIQNCDMKSGIIATYRRSYSENGSYITFSVAPLGSYTGYWQNSNFTPNFD